MGVSGWSWKAIGTLQSELQSAKGPSNAEIFSIVGSIFSHLPGEGSLDCETFTCLGFLCLFRKSVPSDASLGTALTLRWTPRPLWT